MTNILFHKTESTTYKAPVIPSDIDQSAVPKEELNKECKSETKNERDDYMDVDFIGDRSSKVLDSKTENCELKSQVTRLQSEIEELKKQITRLEIEREATKKSFETERTQRLSIANELLFVSSGVSFSKNKIPMWAKKRSRMPYFSCSFDVFRSWRQNQPRHLEYDTMEKEWYLLPETYEKEGPFSKNHFAKIYKRYIEHMEDPMNKNDFTNEYTYVNHDGKVLHAFWNESCCEDQNEAHDVLWLPDWSPQYWSEDIIEGFLSREPRHVYLDPTLVSIEGVRRYFKGEDDVQYLCRFAGYKEQSHLVTQSWIRKRHLYGNRVYGEIIRAYDSSTSDKPIIMGYCLKEYSDFIEISKYHPNNTADIIEMKRYYDQIDINVLRF